MVFVEQAAPARLPPWLDRLAGTLARSLPPLAGELVTFGARQAWASLFAGLMLALLIASHVAWRPDWPIHRYDALLVAAVVIQAVFLATRMESPSEARVILLFHVAGTAMELFKTHVGSWSYPEPALFRIAGVPLFSGFMYATVGSFMVRTIRICDMRFSNHPSMTASVLLAGAIYANFFTHHILPDLRWPLVAATVLLFGRVSICYDTGARVRRMPLPVAALLTAVFLWIAENVGTATGTWVYPGAGGWRMVSLHKLGSWYLLLYVSYVMVTLVVRPRPPGP